MPNQPSNAHKSEIVLFLCDFFLVVISNFTHFVVVGISGFCIYIYERIEFKATEHRLDQVFDAYKHLQTHAVPYKHPSLGCANVRFLCGGQFPFGTAHFHIV